jgi:hypothetical protein
MVTLWWDWMLIHKATMALVKAKMDEYIFIASLDKD